MNGRIIGTLGVLGVGMIVGIVVHHTARSAYRDGVTWCSSENVRGVQRFLQYLVIFAINPIVFVGVVWVMPFDDTAITTLPFIGAIALVSGGIVAFGVARFRGLSLPRQGTQFISGWFTSLGSIGMLVCYQLLGEPGIVLVPMYRLFEEASYYGVAFPLVRQIRDSTTVREGIPRRVVRVVREPIVIVFSTSIAVGVILNRFAGTRPATYASAIDLLVPTGSFLFLVSIGMTMQFSSLRRHWRESLDVVVIKHAFVPVLAVGLITMLGFSPGTDYVWEAVLVLASMPVGLLAVGFASLLDLDVDLANANWLASNGALLIVIPILAWIIASVAA